VKSPKDRVLAIKRVLSAAEACGLRCCGLAPSPVLGGDGNEEYLAFFKRAEEDHGNVEIVAEKTVMEGAIMK
jgi:predicted rRNA methylase YqxC with S4 and FtsJ domains